MDLSQFSTADLRAIRDGKLSDVSTEGLRLLQKSYAPVEPEAPRKSGILAAAQKGTEQALSSGQTALESIFGDKNAAAQRALERGENIEKKYAEQVGLEPLKQAYEKEGLYGAGKELASQIPLAIAEQAPQLATSLGAAAVGSRAGAIGGGAIGALFGGAGAVPGAAIGGTFGGLLGMAVPSLVQQFGSNVERQAEEQKKTGAPVDVNLTAAGLAAVPQAALDVIETRLLFGSKIIGGLLGRSAESVAKMEAAQVEKLVTEKFLGTVLKGTAKGIAAEIPTEVAQQMLERAQAGLALTSPDAIAEYGATAYQVALLGPLGIIGRAADKRAARQLTDQTQVADDVAKVEQELAAGERIQPAAPSAPPTPSLNPERVSQLTEDLIMSGVDLETARAQAVTRATEEAASRQEIPSTPLKSAQESAKTFQTNIPETATLFPEEPALYGPTPEAAPAPQVLDKKDLTAAGIPKNAPIIKRIAGLDLSDLENRSVAIRELSAFAANPAVKPEVKTQVTELAKSLLEPTTTTKQGALQFAPAAPEGPANTQLAAQLSQALRKVEEDKAYAQRQAEEEQRKQKDIEKLTNRAQAQRQLSLAEKQEAEDATETETIGQLEGGGYPEGVSVSLQEPAPEGGAVAEPVGGGVEAVGQPAPEVTVGAQPEPVALSEDPAKQNRSEARKILSAAGFRGEELTGLLADVDENTDLDALRAEYPATEKKGKATVEKAEYLEAAKISDTESVETTTKEEGVAPLDFDAVSSQVGSTSSKPDLAFERLKTGVAALRHIIKKGNPFESVLAARLLAYVNGVRIVVIQPGQPIPPNLSPDKFSESRAIYYEVPATGGKTIYVHGGKFPDGVQGINIRTMLHELLHAATIQKLKAGAYRIDPNSNVTLITQDLINLMRHVGAEYKKLGKDLGIPEIAFRDVREFVTYGMTDPRMQAFMVHVKPPAGRVRTAVSQFVSLIRALFGMGPKHQSAFADLISMTDELIGAKMTKEETRAIRKGVGPMIVEAAQEAEKTDKALKLLKNPKDSGDVISGMDMLIQARDFDERKEVFKAILKGTASKYRPLMLGALTLNQISDVIGDSLPKVSSIIRDMKLMLGAKNAMLKEASDIAQPWALFVRSNPTAARLLGRVMHIATANAIDPDIQPGRSATLDQMWKGIPEEGKKIYRQVRDAYAKRFDDYQKLLEQNVINSGLDSADKIKTLAALRKEFETNKVPQPYFPLMRYGKYWLKFGKGKDTEFYMFESPVARNLFAMKELKARGINKSIEQVIEDGDLDSAMGDSYKQMFDAANQTGKLMRDVIDAIDNSKVTSAAEKEDLKDAIYQMYLLTLPERSFRRQFVHRKNTPGFSADALRNFAKSSFQTANQLARLQYGTGVLNKLEEAKASVEGRPDRPVMDAYINEISDRIKFAMNPRYEDGFGAQLANWLGSLSFVYYLTSPASALVNMASLPVFGLPEIATRFNTSFAETSATMLGYSKKVFSMRGVKDKNGKFTAPSLYESLESADEKQAYKDAQAQGVMDYTLTADMAGLASTPSEKYTGKIRQAANAVSFLFHTTERASREIAFMTGYKLARKNGADHDTAVRQSIDSLHRSLGDYSSVNRARYMRAPIARIAFQFKQFSQQTTFYLVNNFIDMMRGESPAVKKAALTRLVGTLGMTGIFAGVTGLPLYGVIMSAAQKAYSMLKDDDEPDEDLELMFRNWLANTFGKSLGTAIARGPVSWATDIDFHSRLSLNNLWFRDVKQANDEVDAARNMLIDSLGPSVGLAMNVAEAMKRFNDGKVERGLEMLLPAVLRNMFMAGRYSSEGIKTMKGDPIFAEDEVSKGDVFWQAFGFAPNRAADLTQANIKAKGMAVHAERERTDLLRDVSEALMEGNSEKISKYTDKIVAYNKRYPTNAIMPESVERSVMGRMKASGLSQRGLQLSPRMYQLGEKAEYARP